MTPPRLLPLVATVMLLGCSRDTANRIAYATLQNMGQMECRKNPATGCEKPGRYDQYRKERQRLEAGVAKPAAPER